MALELMYTSVPRGLKPGSTGFSTVAATVGMPAPMIDRLEKLSGYRPIHLLGSREQQKNPPEYAHWQISIGGRYYSVLSYVCFAGADYSGRSNKFAHHIVLDANEQSPAGPAWLMMQPGLFRHEWNESPQMLPARDDIPRGQSGLVPCRLWEQHAGDAGWAGAMAESFLLDASKPVYIIRSIELDPRPLVHEALALLPEAARWRATFSTYFNSMPAGLTCTWRFCIAGKEAAQQAANMATSGLIIDLTKPRPLTRDSKYIRMARTGEMPAAAEPTRTVSVTGAMPGQSVAPVDLLAEQKKYFSDRERYDRQERVPDTIDQEHELLHSRRRRLAAVSLAGVVIVALAGAVMFMKRGSQVPAEVARLAEKVSPAPPTMRLTEPQPESTALPAVPELATEQPTSASAPVSDEPRQKPEASAPVRAPEKPEYSVVKAASVAGIPAQFAAAVQFPRDGGTALLPKVSIPPWFAIEGVGDLKPSLQVKLPTGTMTSDLQSLPGLPFTIAKAQDRMTIGYRQSGKADIRLAEVRITGSRVFWAWDKEDYGALGKPMLTQLPILTGMLAWSVLEFQTDEGTRQLQFSQPSKMELILGEKDTFSRISFTSAEFPIVWQPKLKAGWTHSGDKGTLTLNGPQGARIEAMWQHRIEQNKKPELVVQCRLLTPVVEKTKRNLANLEHEVTKWQEEVDKHNSTLTNLNSSIAIEEQKLHIDVARTNLDSAVSEKQAAEQAYNAVKSQYENLPDVKHLQELDDQEAKLERRARKDAASLPALEQIRREIEVQAQKLNENKTATDLQTKLRVAQSDAGRQALRVDRLTAELARLETASQLIALKTRRDNPTKLRDRANVALQEATAARDDAKRDDKARSKISADLAIGRWEALLLAQHSGAVIAEVEIKYKLNK